VRFPVLASLFRAVLALGVLTPCWAGAADRPPDRGAARAPAVLPLPIPPLPPAEIPPPSAAPAAGKPEDAEKTGTTPLKLPRFAALRSDEVNMRAGPGSRYPIEWLYKRRDLPVQIEREFENWRLIRDIEGVRGWVHQATLTGRRNCMVRGAEATLRDAPKDTGAAVAVIKYGIIGRIRQCEATAEWCQVQVGTYRGFLRRDQMWGILPDEAVTP